MNSVQTVHPLINRVAEFSRLEPVSLTKALTWSRRLLNSLGVVAAVVVLAVAFNPTLRLELSDRLAPEDAADSIASEQTVQDNPALISQAAEVSPSVATLAAKIPSVGINSTDVKVLASSKEQQQLAKFIARKYHVANSATLQLVTAAYTTGKEVGIDPLLILGVMAVESSFNPYAESGVGAQGLMQVMTSVHRDKYAIFGGSDSAFNPVANIKVGALVLKDCIARGGSVEAGLRHYVGSTSEGDGGYGAKVLAERARLKSVVTGRPVTMQAQTPAKEKPAPVVVESHDEARVPTADANES